MAESLKELYQSRAQAVADSRKILDRADREKRNLTADEQGQYARLDAEIDSLSLQIFKKEQASAASRRQIPASKPGSASAAAELSFKFGRHSLTVRNGDRLHGLATDAYRDSFRTYLSGGGATKELLSQRVGDDRKGGYLAPMQFVAEFVKFLDNEVYLRQMAKVLTPTTAKSVGAVSFDTDPQDPTWTAEIPASAMSAGTGLRFGARELEPHMLTRLLKSSEKMLRTDTRGFNVESYVAERLAYVFGIVFENAYLTGSGANQPLGVFTASSQGIDTDRDVTSGVASGTDFKADDILDVQYKLKAGYQMNATWIVSREFIKRARKLKDGNGQYLVWDARVPGEPSRLFDRPFVMSEYCPNTFTSGQYVAILGDWTYYWIQDALTMAIQFLDQLFALTNEVGWVGRWESDGMPVLGEAFARLKLA